MVKIDSVATPTLDALVTTVMVTCVNCIVSSGDAIINMIVVNVRIILTVIDVATTAATLDGMSIIAEIEIVIVTMHESAVAASLAVHLVAHRTSAMIEASRLAVGAAVVNDMIPVITYAMVVTVVTGQNAIVDPMVTTTARASRTSVLSMKAITVQLVQVHLRRLTAALR